MRTIFQDNTILLKNSTVKTYLTAQSASGTATLTVNSITGFAVNYILIIGELGNEKSEIIKTHGTTSPSGTTITLASNLVFTHDIGTPVTVIPYDQICFYHATSTSAEKTLLSTSSVVADSIETAYSDSTYSSGYYYTRFKNSISTTYSDYSDPIPVLGFGSNTVGYVIQYALDRVGLPGFTDRITHDFCLSEINSCLRYIFGKRKKWSQLQDFDYVLGQTSQWENTIALPTTMYSYSNKSVLDVRLDGEPSMEYRDEREWGDLLDGCLKTTLNGAVTAGDTSITLTNSYGFPASDGTVYISGQTITYDTNTVATGVLTGVPASGTGAVTANLSDGASVWSDYEDGLPAYYTIKEGYIHFWPIPSSSYDYCNVMMDFWKEVTEVDSDSDEVDVTRFDMVKHWLVWMIRNMIQNDGKLDYNDGDYSQFKDVLNDAIRIEMNTTGQKFKIKPKINTMNYGS